MIEIIALGIIMASIIVPISTIAMLKVTPARATNGAP